MINFIIEILRHYKIGFVYAGYLANIIAIGIVLVLAIITYLVGKKLILNTVSMLQTRAQTQWIEIFTEKKVFTRLSYFLPAMVVMLFASAFYDYYEVIQRLASVYILFVGILVVDAFIDALVGIYTRLDTDATFRPIKSYVEVAKLFIYTLGGIVILALLFDTSPWTLLSGIGALTAVFMLVFKDSLLGLVASIQISAYNLVRIGDWIEVPKYDADGNVIDINLNTIKIRNWDNTITTIPTYALISDSFKNWRGMQESGGRRIKRSFLIDADSVKYYCETELEKLMPLVGATDLSDILDDIPFKGRGITNLALFRRYMTAYLRQNPDINQELTVIVRPLKISEHGIEIQLYMFSRNKDLEPYEALHTRIVEHVLAVLPEFELSLFQIRVS